MFPQTHSPALPSNSLGRFEPLMVDFGPDAPSPVALGPAGAVGRLLYILQSAFPLLSRPPPSPSHQLPCRQLGGARGRPSLSPRCVPAATTAALVPTGVNPEPHTYPAPAVRVPEPPRRAAAAQIGLGSLVRALLPRAARPGRGGSWAPSRRGVVLGVVLGQSPGGRRQNNDAARPRPAPRAPHRLLRSRPEAAGLSGALPLRAARPSAPSRPPRRPAPLRAPPPGFLLVLFTRFAAALPTSPAHSGRRLAVCMPRHPPPVPLPF